MAATSLLPFIRHVWHHHRKLLAGLLLGFVAPWFIFVRVASEVWEGEGLPGDESIKKCGAVGAATVSWVNLGSRTYS